MANTKPKPPYEQQESFALVEELCVELRNVGGVGFASALSGNTSYAIEYVNNVKEIHRVLSHRDVDVAPRLQQLTCETGWFMEELLQDCLNYPSTIPYVRESDGVRRVLRCYLCEEREMPINARPFSYCDHCLKRVADALRAALPFPGIILFRTLNPECRCVHADSDTLLALGDTEQERDFPNQIVGYCEVCITEELAKRRQDASP